jgi:hypothetical protein
MLLSVLDTTHRFLKRIDLQRRNEHAFSHPSPDSPSSTRKPDTARSTIAIQMFSALRAVALVESTH